MKTQMAKALTCQNCGYQWKKRVKGNPVKCPNGGHDWRKPSFFQRLRKAIRSFKSDPVIRGKRVRG